MNRPDPGFSIHEGMFDRTMMLEVLEVLDRVELSRTRAGARLVLTVPAVRALALVACHQDTALPIHREADVPGRGPWSQKGRVVHAIAPATALGQVSFSCTPRRIDKREWAAARLAGHPTARGC